MSADRPRIALIHATPVAIEPVVAAFAQAWPEAELANILDDSLTADRAKQKDLAPEMFPRFSRLARYAVDHGARGILFTCSAFGAAIDAAAREVAVPVLKPNEAMFDAALERGGRIGMIATFGPAMESMAAEFTEAAKRRNPPPALDAVLADGAMEALRSGDIDAHNRKVAGAVGSLGNVDVIMLAHFSTARALAAVQARVSVPVLTSPDAAVARLRACCSE
ncbi:MAG TPA: aspartate/glutamate racemase family protein [Burkholderiales bacterium]